MKEYTDYNLCLLFYEIDQYFKNDSKRFSIKYRQRKYTREALIKVIKDAIPGDTTERTITKQQLQNLITFYNDVNDIRKGHTQKDTVSKLAPLPKLLKILQVFAMGAAEFEGFKSFVLSLKNGHYKELVEKAEQEQDVERDNFHELIKVSDLTKELLEAQSQTNQEIKKLGRSIDRLLKKAEKENKEAEQEMSDLAEEIIELAESKTPERFKEQVLELLKSKIKN